MTGDREQCLAAGMDAYIARPIRPAELIALVEERGTRSLPAEPVRLSVNDPGEDLQVLDEAALLALVGGDEPLMHEIIDLYLQEYPRLLGDIRAAAASGDVRALQFSAHALKGSVGNMAAARAHKAAMEVEALARADQLEGARGALPALERELLQLHDGLSGLALRPVP